MAPPYADARHDRGRRDRCDHGTSASRSRPADLGAPSIIPSRSWRSRHERRPGADPDAALPHSAPHSACAVPSGRGHPALRAARCPAAVRSHRTLPVAGAYSHTVVVAPRVGSAHVVIAWVLTVLTFGYFLPWAVRGDAPAEQHPGHRAAELPRGLDTDRLDRRPGHGRHERAHSGHQRGVRRRAGAARRAARRLRHPAGTRTSSADGATGTACGGRSTPHRERRRLVDWSRTCGQESGRRPRGRRARASSTSTTRRWSGPAEAARERRAIGAERAAGGPAQEGSGRGLPVGARRTPENGSSRVSPGRRTRRRPAELLADTPRRRPGGVAGAVHDGARCARASRRCRPTSPGSAAWNKPLAVAADRDRDRQPRGGRGLAQGDPEVPGRVLVEAVEHQAGLLRLQLVEQLAPGHRSASRPHRRPGRTLTRAASRTSAVATASAPAPVVGPRRVPLGRTSGSRRPTRRSPADRSRGLLGEDPVEVRVRAPRPTALAEGRAPVISTSSWVSAVVTTSEAAVPVTRKRGPGGVLAPAPPQVRDRRRSSCRERDEHVVVEPVCRAARDSAYTVLHRAEQREGLVDEVGAEVEQGAAAGTARRPFCGGVPLEPRLEPCAPRPGSRRRPGLAP